MTNSLSAMRAQITTSAKHMDRRQQIDYHIAALRRLGVTVTVSAPEQEKRDDNGFAKRAATKLYIGRTSLHYLVVESEYVVTERLRKGGFMECVRGKYFLTDKGKAIGRQEEYFIKLHVQRAVEALGLTLKA